MFLIYSFLYIAAMFILLPYEYARRPRDVRNRWLRERFGFISLPPASGLEVPVWVHAVSVGEVLSAVSLVRELKRKYPSLRIILSTVTDTGQKVAHERLSGSAHVVYLPFDLVFVLRRLLKNVRPALFIVMETELWPNIFRLLRKEDVPILVFNGRISDDSFRGYRKIRFFMRKVLGCVDFFGMQDDIYRKRIEDLGAEEKKVQVVGNFKFDTEPPHRLPDWSAFLKGPVIVAGSTHEGEEELIISAFENLRQDIPSLNLVLAPRHPERFGRVEEIVKARGLSYTRRSSLVYGSQSTANRTFSGTILILDTIGELASTYGIADVAVIGGSFVHHGGQNPLEPAFWGKPVVCGPHMENFPFIQEFFIGSGAIKTDGDGLSNVLRGLLMSPEKRSSMGERARALYSEKAGAVKKTMAILENYLKPEFLLSKKESSS